MLFRYLCFTLNLLPCWVWAQSEFGVAHPTRGSVIRYVNLPGALLARQEATLHAKTSGYLKAIQYDKGDSVKADALIAELESPELEADVLKCEAETAALKPALEYAEQEYERMQKARKASPDLVLPQMVEKTKAELDKSKAAFDVVAASAKKSRAMLEYTKVKAPFGGIITKRYVDPGALLTAGTSSVSSGSAVVTLMDLSSVRAQVAIPEVDASFVAKDQPVVITVEGLPGKIFKASVTRFSYALDAATRCMLVESEVPNADLALRPGMYATIKVGVQKHDDALLVPVDALAMEKANAFLYLHDNGKAKKTAITLGFNDGVMVEVAKDPLTGKLAIDESAQVLLVGKATMTADQPVKLKQP